MREAMPNHNLGISFRPRRVTNYSRQFLSFFDVNAVKFAAGGGPMHGRSKAMNGYRAILYLTDN